MATVDDIRGAAARWLIDHPDRAGRIEADDPKLLAYVVAQTGRTENKVFDTLVDQWPAIEAIAEASSTSRRKATGGVAAQLLARGFESPPIAGVTVHQVEDTSWIDDRILLRTLATDKKGRTYGTPGNPGVPPLDRFRPRFFEVRAGDLEALIKERKHGRFEDQRRSIAELDQEALFRFRPEDPMSATEEGGGLSLTGGHHRTWEIIDRVNEGRIPPDAKVRILVHD